MEKQSANNVIPKEEAPEKPSIVKIVVPFVATALIFWWIFRGINFEALKQSLAEARLSLAIPAMVAYCLLFYAIDVVSFGLGYKWYVTDKVSWKDVAIIRGGMYLPQVALPPVAEIIPPTYFLRRWRVRVLHTLGAEFFVYVCDTYQNVTLLTLGLIIAGTSLGVAWIVFVAAMWALLAVIFIYWLTPLHDRVLTRVRDSAFMIGFRNSRLKHYLTFYAIRGLFIPANLIVAWALLDALGVRLPIQRLMLFAPVMMASTFLPISAGGYGGPQGAAVLILVQLFHDTSEETALAYSLLWSSFFALGRAGIGAVFAYPVWSLLQKKYDEH